MSRWKEPSTYAGIAAIIGGAGVLGKVNEAPAIADAVNTAAIPLAQGNWQVGLGMIVAGILSVLLKEKSNGNR